MHSLHKVYLKVGVHLFLLPKEIHATFLTQAKS